MMEALKKVLLVTNGTTETEINLIKEAINYTKTPNVKISLSLVHIIPNLPTCYFSIPSTVLLAERYYAEAEEYLNIIGNTLEVGHEDRWLISGRIKSEVVRLAYTLKAQFILASSSNIPELHKSFFFKKDSHSTLIQNISNVNKL
jgi:hypothetical protein